MKIGKKRVVQASVAITAIAVVGGTMYYISRRLRSFRLRFRGEIDWPVDESIETEAEHSHI